MLTFIPRGRLVRQTSLEEDLKHVIHRRKLRFEARLRPSTAPIPRYWTPSDFVHEDGADREGREWNEEPARVENVDVYSITRLPPDALLTFYYTIL